MKRNTLIGSILICFAMLITSSVSAQSRPTTPPEGKYKSFYKKYLDANGVAIISSENVSDSALIQTAKIVTLMLAKCDKAREYLISHNCCVMIIGANEQTCDLPEYKSMCRNEEEVAYWNKRARGFGGAPGNDCACSAGEENILALPGDRYIGESILVHEFSHIVCSEGIAKTEPGFRTKLKDIFNHAKDNGLWEKTYSLENPDEYWAEGVQSFFNCNRYSDPANGIHNFCNRREKLKEYDPQLYELISIYFNEIDLPLLNEIHP